MGLTGEMSMTTSSNENTRRNPAGSPASGNVVPLRRIAHAADVGKPKSRAHPSVILPAHAGDDDDPGPTAA
jgi:hypothetical protein